MQKRGTSGNNGQSCYQAVYQVSWFEPSQYCMMLIICIQIPLMGQLHAARGIVLSAARSFEAPWRARCRRRQLYHQRKPDCGKGQVTKSGTSTCQAVRHKQTCDNSTYVDSEHDQVNHQDLPAKNDGTSPNPQSNNRFYKRTIQTAEPLKIEALEEKIGCLAIALERGPIRAVSPGVEEAYMRGEPLTPPEIEFSDHSDMEDDYWTWDQDTERFRHWDEDLEEWVSFPERFD